MVRKKIQALYTWFSKSFSRKIMFTLLICISFIIAFSSITYYYSTIELLQKSYIDSNEQLLKEVNQSVSRYYSQLDETTRSLYNDNTFINNLYTHQYDYVSIAYNEQAVTNILRSDDAIQYIYFYDPYTQNLHSFSRENISYSHYPDIEKEKWYQKTLNSEHYLYVAPLHTFQNYTNFGTLENDTVFSVNRAIRYYVTGDIIGMLSISYDTSYLEKICQNLNSENGFISILDENLNARLTNYPGGRIPHSIKDTINKADGIRGYYKYDSDDGRRILLWNSLDGIYLLKDITLEELTANALIVSQITFMVSAAIFILSIIIALYFSHSATSKLKMLTNNIAKFGDGSLTINTTDYGTDEIGQLASAFNHMTERINELINLEYKAKVLRKNAELQALQAQIKPHFINNTLQAIGTLGLKKGAKDVYFMANALAKMLRYTLKSTSQLVPLSKEIENMNDYLYIQRILWNDRLKVDLQVEERLEDWPVPVLILQPLVENSIKHGLDDRTEGSIHVDIHTIEEALFIQVTDNGRGIPDASLLMLQSWLEEEDMTATDEHIGIRNIAGRLRLIYGDRANLTIFCPETGGTCIQIILPDKERNHYV